MGTLIKKESKEPSPLTRWMIAIGMILIMFLGILCGAQRVWARDDPGPYNFILVAHEKTGDTQSHGTLYLDGEYKGEYYHAGKTMKKGEHHVIKFIPDIEQGYYFKGIYWDYFVDDDPMADINRFTTVTVNEDNSVTVDLTTPDANICIYFSVEYRGTYYDVQYFYEKDGVFPEEPTETSEQRFCIIGDTVSVTDADKEPAKEKYHLDDWSYDDWKGTALVNNGLHLKVYFKESFTITYLPGEHGWWATHSDEYHNIEYNAWTPYSRFEPYLEHNYDYGYTFDGWEPEVAKKVTGDATYTAKWKANTDTPYYVSFFYEADGKYSDEPDETIEAHGTTDSLAEVTEEEKTPMLLGYDLDESRNDAWSGTIAGNGSLQLKVYFKEHDSQEEIIIEDEISETVESDGSDISAKGDESEPVKGTENNNEIAENAVKTGDNQGAVLWAVIMAGALALIVLTRLSQKGRFF